MSILCKDRGNQIYYYCRAHYCAWIKDPCTYNRFILGTWDQDIWEEIAKMLSNDARLDQQLTTELSQNVDLEKLIRLEQFKINEAKTRVSTVQAGWEKGFYPPAEVHTKLAEHREAIVMAESEIERLHAQMANKGLSAVEAELLWQELRELRDRNLQEATFEGKSDLIAKRGIKVLPSEFLKSRKILCRLNLVKTNNQGTEQTGFAKVTFGGLSCPIRRTKTFELTFSLA
jgi:hypothetical protein